MAKKTLAAPAAAQTEEQPKEYHGAVRYREDKQPRVDGDPESAARFIHFDGVPWADLTAEQFDEIKPWTRRAMIESGIYELVEG